MSRPSLSLSVVGLLLLSTAATAQNVFIVDGLNRPGTHFTDLPAAEAAAQPGDVLDLRPDGGPYTAITTSKGLRILANFASIRVTHTNPFRVLDLPAGQDFVLQRGLISLNQPPGVATVEALRCTGRVHFEQLDVSNYTSGPGIAVVDCSAVTLRECRVVGGWPALFVRDSTVVLTGSTLVGGPADSAPAGDGIIAVQSRLQLAGCQVSGGATFSSQSPGAAATLHACSVTAGGGAIGGWMKAGSSLRGSPASVPAVRGQSSLLELDPGLPVTGTGSQPVVGVAVVNRTVPSLVMHGVSVVLSQFEGDPTAATATLIGVPSDPIYSAAFSGALWIAPPSLVTLPGVFGGYRPLGLPPGTTLAFQVASVTTTGVELSNVVIATAP